MITKEKIEIFDSYGGDIDGLLRVGQQKEKFNLKGKSIFGFSGNKISKLTVVS